MEFINKMKKREYIEMGLKTLAAILAAFLAIILMEGMIYGIQLNALKTKSTTASAASGSTIAYCIHSPEKGNDDRYFVKWMTYFIGSKPLTKINSSPLTSLTLNP